MANIPLGGRLLALPPRGERPCKTGNVGAALPQAKRCGATRQGKPGDVLLWRPHREFGPANTLTLDFWPLDIKEVGSRGYTPPGLWGCATTDPETQSNGVLA